MYPAISSESVGSSFILSSLPFRSRQTATRIVGIYTNGLRHRNIHASLVRLRMYASFYHLLGRKVGAPHRRLSSSRWVGRAGHPISDLSVASGVGGPEPPPFCSVAPIQSLFGFHQNSRRHIDGFSPTGKSDGCRLSDMHGRTCRISIRYWMDGGICIVYDKWIPYTIHTIYVCM